MKAVKNLIGSVFIAIAAFVFWAFVLPIYEKTAYLESLVTTRTVMLDSKSRLIQKVDALNKAYQDKFNELKRLSLVVPSKKNVAEIITTIDDTATKSGIQVSELTVSEQKELGTGNSYGIVSLNLNFVGNYESILIFLDYLEKHIRLIDSTALGISIKGYSPGDQNIILSSTLKASSYIVKPIVASPPPIIQIGADEK